MSHFWPDFFFTTAPKEVHQVESQDKTFKTGRNVANLQEEFGINPLNKSCSPTSLTVSQREMPENGPEIIELLERLFWMRASETEPDVLAEINQLIDDTCNGR